MKVGKDLPLWDDIILWNVKYQADFDAGLKIGKDCPGAWRTSRTE
jgi:hypothetical protein